MRNIFITLVVLVCNCTLFGQSTLNSTTEEYDNNVDTQNNSTTINLFNIEYNGSKIPINLIYSHDGVKVNEDPDSNTGVNWRIGNIGAIERIVNYKLDNSPTGWFNTLNPSFSSSFSYHTCIPENQGDCSTFGKLNEDDLSPDYFSLNMINGINFDFLYKKNIQNNVVGIPTPVFLSNNYGYKLNTNFSNFNLQNNDVVFNIQDTNGNNYDFLNGPSLTDINRSFEGVRNNFYLKTIYNPSNADVVNIEYYTKNIMRKKFYGSGYVIKKPSCLPQNYDYLQCIENNEDYDNDIARYSNLDYYKVNESRFDLKKISTNNLFIDFIYTPNEGYLDEINITDLYGNFVTGYKFEYQPFQGTSANSLYKVSKYNNDRTQLQILYEFEYYDGLNFFADNGQPEIIENRQLQDYFGYFNNEYKTNLLLFPARNTNGIVIPPGNYEPNISFAKHHSLKKIINKYGGISEFDYQLKMGTNSLWGSSIIYGAGLVISSKKTIPQIGNSTNTTYNYQNLRGLTLVEDFLDVSFMSHYTVTKLFTSTPKLIDNESTPLQQFPFGVSQKQGSFFGTVTESVYDLSSMNLMSRNINEYIPNIEGIYRRPLMSNQIYKNAADVEVKRISYNYDMVNLETINSAEYLIESRSQFSNSGKYFIKTDTPLYVNRVSLASRTETVNTTSGDIINTTNYNYFSSNNILRNTVSSSSLGVNKEERYYYAQDNEVALDPNVSTLVSQNIIGIPLLKQIYNGTEKLSEEKTVYANDSTTNNLLLPKYEYAKKGTDINSALEKTATYDSYDDKGNVTQYTPENGVPDSIIWGYNKTKPIAKISNIAYANIPANLITAAQNASNINNNEANLLTALNAIRVSTTPALVNAMITTYTYIPLVGVSTITDPKGDKILYTYDSYGRLQNVRDKDNNILSEKDYYYISQN